MAKGVKYGVELEGRSIQVFWPLDNKYYGCVINKYDAKSRKHKVKYEDGDEEVLDLLRERWRFTSSEEKSLWDKAKSLRAISIQSANTSRIAEIPENKRSAQHPENIRSTPPRLSAENARRAPPEENRRSGPELTQPTGNLSKSGKPQPDNKGSTNPWESEPTTTDTAPAIQVETNKRGGEKEKLAEKGVMATPEPPAAGQRKNSTPDDAAPGNGKSPATPIGEQAINVEASNLTEELQNSVQKSIQKSIQNLPSPTTNVKELPLSNAVPDASPAAPNQIGSPSNVLPVAPAPANPLSDKVDDPRVSVTQRVSEKVKQVRESLGGGSERLTAMKERGAPLYENETQKWISDTLDEVRLLREHMFVMQQESTLQRAEILQLRSDIGMLFGQRSFYQPVQANPDQPLGTHKPADVSLKPSILPKEQANALPTVPESVAPSPETTSAKGPAAHAFPNTRVGPGMPTGPAPKHNQRPDTQETRGPQRMPNAVQVKSKRKAPSTDVDEDRHLPKRGRPPKTRPAEDPVARETPPMNGGVHNSKPIGSPATTKPPGQKPGIDKGDKSTKSPSERVQGSVNGANGNKKGFVPIRPTPRSEDPMNSNKDSSNITSTPIVSAHRPGALDVLALRPENKTDYFDIAKCLVAISSSIWVVENASEPQDEDLTSWARDVGKTCFSSVVAVLEDFRRFPSAVSVFRGKVREEVREFDWLVFPNRDPQFNNARRNYRVWKPPLTDEEWCQEMVLLKGIQLRFFRGNLRLKNAESQASINLYESDPSGSILAYAVDLAELSASAELMESDIKILKDLEMRMKGIVSKGAFHEFHQETTLDAGKGLERSQPKTISTDQTAKKLLPVGSYEGIGDGFLRNVPRGF
ncbi:hypothetical protein NDN08_006804 [Rhodosorus marinus]|uniref:Uncharacterized protein n=1 Tax=Rhodosorus marinus TaxID=101924 RepID=A0AAV8UIY9_9RHOD|nr:hypothetical protein NDN08_006804 [Rhodosorus marinus]